MLSENNSDLRWRATVQIGIMFSHVKHFLAGEFGLVGDEGEARFGLGAHQAFDGICGVLAVVY